MNRDEFYTAFKHDIITSKLKPGELLKEKQIMQDYTGIYYANPYERTQRPARHALRTFPLKK